MYACMYVKITIIHYLVAIISMYSIVKYSINRIMLTFEDQNPTLVRLATLATSALP